MFGSAFEEHTWLGNREDNLNENRQDIAIQNNNFRLASYAWRCFNFCKIEGLGLTRGLSVLPNANGSNFVADGFLGISLPLTEPTIRLEAEDSEHENTMYHEFGHFFMWNIQGKNFINPIQLRADGSHRWDEENSSRLAWFEGWASGFGAIMDAAHFWEDQEYGYDGVGGQSLQRRFGAVFEGRHIGWDNLINNGINSEYFIACAIYDLWDGANKGLPVTLPGSGSGGNNVLLHGFDDSNSSWAFGQDQVQLSFNQIARPMQIRSGAFSKLNNIDEYLQVLLQDIIGDDCVLRKRVSDCFQQNRVVFDIRAWVARPGNTALSTGGWRTYRNSTFVGVDFLGSKASYTETYSLNADFTESGQTQTVHAYPFTKAYVTEDITIGVDNPNTEFDFSSVLNINTAKNSRANPYSTSIITLKEESQDSRVYETCGDPQIRVFNGTMRFGSTAGIPVANLNMTGASLLQVGSRGILEVNENADIVVRAGTTLVIQAGAQVIVRGDGSINVEAGGYVCISDEANIQIGPNAKFIINAGAIKGVNPWLAINGAIACGDVYGPGFTRLPGCRNEALSFDGVDDYLEIPDATGKLNLGTSDFTMEALINSSGANTTNSIQIIASKRNAYSPSDGREADGFMFGLWETGQLYVQLGGTPNLGYDRGDNLIDGKCHHVAVTRKDGTVYFYKDGSLYYSETVGNRNINSEGSFRIGRNHLSGLPFKGLIGEVRIWNYARSASQLEANMKANLPAQNGLVGYWDMNGSTAFEPDLSGNGNTGRLGNDDGTDLSDPTRKTSCDLACNFQGNFRKGTQGDISSIENVEVHLSIYPNPSNMGKFSIEGINNISKVEVFDINGIATNFVFENGELTLPQQQKGVYQVVISTDGKRHRKLVVLN